MPVDVTSLRHFVAVAEELHFARAAKKLNISRQVLSASVKSLEAELGAELFDRSAEKTTLSVFGRDLVANSGPLIEAEQRREDEAAAAAALPATLSISFVPGVTIGKWTNAWEERYPGVSLRVRPGSEEDSVTVLHDGMADLSFVRLPVKRHRLSVVPLYTEVGVVVVPKDHPIAALDSLTLADLAGEQVAENPASVSDAVELVAAGVGLLRLPQSIARLHARKDVVARPVSDAPVTEIALAWLEDELSPDMEEFVGIVRGRTAATSRTTTALAGTPPNERVSPAAAEPAAKASAAGKPAKKAPAKPAKGAKKPVQHSRAALQARNRKRGGGR
jgi:DNA-binding transcriptional LysR family regulator